MSGGMITGEQDLGGMALRQAHAISDLIRVVRDEATFADQMVEHAGGLADAGWRRERTSYWQGYGDAMRALLPCDDTP